MRWMPNAFLDWLVDPLLALPRAAKRIIAVVVDTAICVFTVWFAFYLRLGDFVPLTGNASWAVVAAVVFAIPIFIVSGLYRAIFRYSGWPALLTVARAVGIYGLLYAATFTAISLSGVPRTVGLIQPILLLFVVGASRVLVRLWLGGHYENILRHAARPKVLIYGAGAMGRELAVAMSNSPEMQVIGFLDDDVRLRGSLLNGLPVHSPEDIEILIEKRGVAHVLLAMPDINRRRRNEVIEKLGKLQVSVRTLPSISDLAQGRVTVSDLRELDVEDLLGRDPVVPDMSLLQNLVLNRVIMVTGAGGSIGSELCRQIIKSSPAKLILVENSEYALYTIHSELERRSPDNKTELVPLLASVDDEQRMRNIMRSLSPHTVYHAAAYKHVPLVEHNPGQGIRNNSFGTLHLARAAAASGVHDFVLISTDKAVRPTNLMGASKRLAELILQAIADTGAATTFSMVRFGNVLGSSGSVVPKFRTQIREGGPITLTHPDIIRYFMTISEAAQLVLQASAMAKGGEVFVLDMGEPVRIFDLARKMIELSGLTLRDADNPDGDIEIQITGLRPGEKLFEELLIGDNPQPTPHARILRANETFMPLSDLEPKLESLKNAIAINDVSAMKGLIGEMVVEYVDTGIMVDSTYQRQYIEIAAP